MGSAKGTLSLAGIAAGLAAVSVLLASPGPTVVPTTQRIVPATASAEPPAIAPAVAARPRRPAPTRPREDFGDRDRDAIVGLMLLLAGHQGRHSR
jgi:hypothetical protein